MSTAAPAPELRSELRVSGMTCGNCVRHVEEALNEIPDVRAEVDLAAATASVHHPASVPVALLLDAVVDAGYEVAVHDAQAR